MSVVGRIADMFRKCSLDPKRTKTDHSSVLCKEITEQEVSGVGRGARV
jgi:hypothetical protein